MDDDEDFSQYKSNYQVRKADEPAPRRKPKRLIIPRRKPTVIIPPRERIYITPDKTVCKECTCFPKEDPYVRPKKLNPCQKSPLTLYELTARIVDRLKFPAAFMWTIQQVADWMENVVGLPEYKTCMIDNFINGRRLLMLEDPSHMPDINIHNLDHVKMITSKVRETFSTEFVLFCRSIGLPPRKPLTHCTWFKSRTGPTWGIRQNWTRCDILRWMKIIMPAPVYLDHWDLVWYQKPDFPKVLFGKIPKRTTFEHIPHYVKPKREVCKEYTAPRKFRLHKDLSESKQQIWMEHREGSPVPKEGEQKAVRKKKKKEMKRWTPTVPKKSRLDRPVIFPEGLVGKELILARRRMPKKKFLFFGK